MAGPVWLTGIFAAVMITVAVYCSGRLVMARRWRRPTELDTDGGHVAMGLAMAGMLVERLRVLPAGAWEAVFAAGAIWFGWRVLQARRGAPSSPWRCLHPTPHLVECAAMLYMFLVLPASLAARSTPAGMGGMSAPAAGSRFSLLALVLALFMFGYVVWLGDRLSARAPALAFPAARHRALAVSPASGPRAEASGPAAQQPAPGCASPDPRSFLAPRCAALCQLAMGLTMGYMLIMLL
ncbi:MAG: DUF5134 domain-containing protein [Streptosporangiaceae bacterium]